MTCCCLPIPSLFVEAEVLITYCDALRDRHCNILILKKGDILCFEAVEDFRDELPNPWVGVCGCGVWLKVIVALFIWSSFYGVH